METSYEPFAEVYLASTDKKPYTTYYERPFIISKLPELKGKDVLDLGCATGYYSKYCLDKGATVTSVDASRKMVNYTKDVCEHRIEAYVHDIAQPFTFLESNSMDLIICSLVLHYLESWEQTLKELHRVLRPGGFCIISTHHPVNDYSLFNSENYFDKRMIEDEWNGFGQPLKVKYFVRPLNEYLQPILNSDFILKELAEPEPADELKDIDEKVYKRLLNRPAFLFFILMKE